MHCPKCHHSTASKRHRVYCAKSMTAAQWRAGNRCRRGASSSSKPDMSRVLGSASGAGATSPSGTPAPLATGDLSHTQRTQIAFVWFFPAGAPAELRQVVCGAALAPQVAGWFAADGYTAGYTVRGAA